MSKAIATSLLLLCIIFVASCNEKKSSNEITQAELVTRMADNSRPLIIDVRSVEEFQQSHVPGAINLPHDTFSELPEHLKLDKNDELVVYCESGKRAELVINTLEKQGYFEIRHLEGDMRAWRNAGLETE
jgi:rhodanese-related sulfurtransferase